MPFCVVKCGYCDFNSFADVDGDDQSKLIDVMIAEMRARTGQLRPRTIFFGGGTPTHVAAGDLERLLDAVRRLDLGDLVEWTSEANPESCTQDKAYLLANKGVTRISLGVQSWDAERLRFMDRPHDAAEAETAYHHARNAGVDVSLDMIFGLPGQSLEAWQVELERTIDLEPDHVSCYQLTFEPGTPLEAARRRGRVQPNEDEVLRDMLLWTRERLAEAGYEAYEISNFARPGKACQHNLAYWRSGDYVGIGPGAASHERGKRATNLRPLGSYAEAVQATGCAHYDAETLSPGQQAAEACWLSLRTREGIDPVAIEQRTGVDPLRAFAPTFRIAREQGELEDHADRIRVPTHRIAFTDSIAARFLGD